LDPYLTTLMNMSSGFYVGTNGSQVEDRAEVRLVGANPKSTISLTMCYALFYYINKHVICWFLDVGNNGI